MLKARKMCRNNLRLMTADAQMQFSFLELQLDRVEHFNVLRRSYQYAHYQERCEAPQQININSKIQLQTLEMEFWWHAGINLKMTPKTTEVVQAV